MVLFRLPILLFVVASSLFHIVFCQTELIYAPDKSLYYTPGIAYPRGIRLANGILLSTWEDNTRSERKIPIYSSYDGGRSWSLLSHVRDQNNVGGLRFQPFLYQLKGRVGNLPTGTILLAVNASPDSQKKTSIDIYASKDGVSWEYLSTVAQSGAAIPQNGYMTIWEPFTLEYDGELLCYFSDQRSRQHGQKLVVSRSSDAIHWSEAKDVVTYPHYKARPGMATVAYIPSSKNYILTYELYDPVFAKKFEVYYRLSNNPLNFLDKEGIRLSAHGVTPTSSPYVITRNSDIYVSCGTMSQLFVNANEGERKSWQMMSTNAPFSYSRSLVHVPGQILIFAAEGPQEASKWHVMTVTAVSIRGRSRLAKRDSSPKLLEGEQPRPRDSESTPLFT